MSEPYNKKRIFFYLAIFWVFLSKNKTFELL